MATVAALLPPVLAGFLSMALHLLPAGVPRDAVLAEVVTVTIAGRGAPVVVLKEAGSSRVLPIGIGSSEADAIWTKLIRQTHLRPLTHDLIRNILEGTRARMRSAVIYAERDGIYYAYLLVEANGRRVKVDSRPSDAIALALRCGAPVFVARDLMLSPSSFDISEHAMPIKIGGITLQGMTPELASHLGVETAGGVLVADVRSGRFAGKLLRGDVLVEIGGEPVGGLLDALRRIQGLAQAKAVEVKVIRQGEERALTLPAIRGKTEGD